MTTLGQIIADMKAHPYRDHIERNKTPQPPRRERFFAKDGLEEIIRGNEIKSLARASAGVCGLTTDDLYSNSRKPNVVHLRGVFVNACIARGFAKIAVGRYLGLHHTSVVYLCKQAYRFEDEVEAVLRKAGK